MFYLRSFDRAKSDLVEQDAVLGLRNRLKESGFRQDMCT
jgi:hypothetical protein